MYSYSYSHPQIAKNNRMKTPLGRELAPVSILFLLRLFPFGVVINTDMQILGAGDKLLQAWGGSSSILNKHVTDVFKLRRPKGISFTWGNVRDRFMANKRESVTFPPSFPRIFSGIKGQRYSLPKKYVLSASNFFLNPVLIQHLKKQFNHFLRYTILKINNSK